MSEKIITSCALDCWDACSIIATVDAGKIVSLEGNPEHPITQGFLCGKTQRFAERVYDPNRVLHPMKRRGSIWEKISWEQAFDELSLEIQRLKKGPGTQSIFHIQSSGSMGLMKKLTVRFFNLLGGVSEADGDVCLGAGQRAMMDLLGEPVTHAFEDLPNSKLIILWGRNPYGANIHLVPFLKEAKKRGSQIILIDPVSIGGGNVIDWHLRPQPGSDFLLAIALLRYGMEKKWIRPGENWEKLEEQLLRYDLKSIPKKTGLSEKDIARLAKLYWETQPASIWMGSGLQHHQNGVEVVKLLLSLVSASGNLGISGGGLSFYERHTKYFRLDLVRPNLDAKYRKIPVGQFPRILPTLNPKVEMIWINGANPVAAMPGSEETAQALRSAKTVVLVDTHLTDTAECATHFLPTTTFLEENGVISSWGQNYIARQREVVPPQGESKTDLQITQELAKRLGLEKELQGDESHWEKEFLSKGPGNARGNFGFEGKDYIRNPYLNPIPCSGGQLPNGAKAFRFPADLNLEAIPFPQASEEFPYHLLTPKPKSHHLSQVIEAREEDLYPIWINPESQTKAAPAGTRIRVKSKSGEIFAKLLYDHKLPKNVAVLPLSGSVARKNCANLLTGGVPDTADPACPGYYSCFVRLSAE